MMKYQSTKKLIFLFFLFLLIIAQSSSLAQYTFFLPEETSVSEPLEYNITMIYGKPYSGIYFDINNIENLSVLEPNDTILDLEIKEELVKGYINDVISYNTTYTINSEGDYILFADFELKNVDGYDYSYVEDHIKTIIHFNESKGWDQSTNQIIEIIPITRPYGIEEGFVFVGQVFYNQNPLAHTLVEIEKYYEPGTAPRQSDESKITRETKTDSNGIFSYTLEEEGTYVIISNNIIDNKNIRGILTLETNKEYPVEKPWKNSINRLNKNTNILDQNVQFLHNNLQNSNMILTIFGIIIIILIILIIFLFQRVGKKKEETWTYQSKNKLISFCKNMKKSCVYKIYSYKLNFIKKILTKSRKSKFFKGFKKRNTGFFIWANTHPFKALLIFYFIFVILKIIITQISVDLTTGSGDSFLYLKMGRSFFLEQNFMVAGEPAHKYPPLYSIIISPSFLFSNMLDVYRAVLIINAFVSSLIIFPAFLISKRFLNTKNSILVAIIVSLLAGSFVFTFRALSENLYYPLLLLTVYVLFRSIEEKSYKWQIFSGVLVGLCFLTRYSSVALILGSLFAFILIELYRNKKAYIKSILYGFKNWFIISIIAGITAAPWLLRNAFHFGYSLPGVLGYTGEVTGSINKLGSLASGQPVKITQTVTGQPTLIDQTVHPTINFIVSYTTQIILHNGFLILGSGVIFFIFALLLLFKSKKEQNQKLFFFGLLIFIIAEFYVLLTAWHHFGQYWRLMGRYSEPVIPLVIIFGTVGLIKLKTNSKVLIAMLLSIIPLSFLVFLEGRGMGALLSIANIVSIKRFSEYSSVLNIDGSFISQNASLFTFLALLIIVLFFFWLVYIKASKKSIAFFAVLLILSSTAISSAAYIVANSHTSDSTISEVGRFLNDEVSGTNKVVAFDKNLTKEINRRLLNTLGCWTNAPMIIKDLSEENLSFSENTNYIISLEKLNYHLTFNTSISDPLGEVLSWKPDRTVELYIYDLTNT